MTIILDIIDTNGDWELPETRFTNLQSTLLMTETRLNQINLILIKNENNMTTTHYDTIIINIYNYILYTRIMNKQAI